jgi:hypothetical protein
MRHTDKPEIQYKCACSVHIRSTVHVDLWKAKRAAMPENLKLIVDVKM